MSIKSEIQRVDDFKEYELKWISKEGYTCYIRMIEFNKNVPHHRCGYVRVDKNNITNEISSENDLPISIHGGLTYGSNGLWGFDCAHFYDTLDKWTLQNVKKEVESLSKQLSNLTWEKIISKKMENEPQWFIDRVINKSEMETALKTQREDFKEILDINCKYSEKLEFELVIQRGDFLKIIEDELEENQMEREVGWYGRKIMLKRIKEKIKELQNSEHQSQQNFGDNAHTMCDSTPVDKHQTISQCLGDKQLVDKQEINSPVNTQDKIPYGYGYPELDEAEE